MCTEGHWQSGDLLSASHGNQVSFEFQEVTGQKNRDRLRGGLLYIFSSTIHTIKL